MTEIQEYEVKEYIRTMQSRMVRHSFDHLPETMENRTAMIVVKNELLKSIPDSPISEHVSQVIVDPEHKERFTDSNGPFILYCDGENSRGLIDITTILLNPELRLRRAAIAELDRQIIQHSKNHRLFLNPQTRQRIDELRETVSSDDIRESLTASIEINDLLVDDYFYQLAGVRQCNELRLDNELPELLNRILAPNQRTIQFLLQLPVWSPSRQQPDIERFRNRIIEEMSSLDEVLREYFRLFGHLPLAGNNSATGVVASWIEKHGLPDDPWELIWNWANINGSPLACYHACQLICGNPEWIPEGYYQAILEKITGIVLGAANNERWQLRCNLARHYCRHLEALDSGADGERVAAFAWWLSESLSAMIDRFSSDVRKVCVPILNDAFKVSDEVWGVARPPASASSLRYATLFSKSVWATSILCELSGSGLLNHVSQVGKEMVELEKALCGLSYNSVVPGVNEQGGFAFEFSTTLLTQHIARVKSDSVNVSLDIVHSTLTTARLDCGLVPLIKELSKADDSTAKIVAHELRLQSMCGVPPCETLFESFSDVDWRNGVLGKFDEQTVELVCTAAIEIALHDSERDWRTYLPHFLAIACEESQQEDRKRLLFAYTLVASLATDSVSAVERLLKGEGRRDYEEYVSNWRKRIEDMTPVSPAWISSKLRGMKSILYIG